MNNREKVYSSIVIIMTAISVSILLSYKDNCYDYGDVNLNQEQFQVNDYDKNSHNSVNKGMKKINDANQPKRQVINSNSDSNSNNNSNNNSKDNLNNSKEKDNISEEAILKKDDNGISKDDIYADNNAPEKYSINDETVQTMSVFKVDKSAIMSKIGVADKAKLLYISRKLSSSDCNNIEDDLKSSDELEAAEDIFKILKHRLSSEDYQKVKNILSPYINVEYIDSNIDR